MVDEQVTPPKFKEGMLVQKRGGK